jgi:hypothetical protein
VSPVDFYCAYLERALIRLIVGLPFFGKVGASVGEIVGAIVGVRVGAIVGVRVLLMQAEVRL